MRASSLYRRLYDALAWRVRRALGDELVDGAFVTIARSWRPFLKRPVFIGISGSAGKTTTKELLLGVLSYKGRGTGNPGSLNVAPEVAKTILRVRRKHDFCVAELSEDKPGVLDLPLALLQPSVGIVTVIGNDHWSAFGAHSSIAIEVGKLIASLPANGTAILNADDALVNAMTANCAAKTMTYGISHNADLRAEDISSVWPDRLQVSVVRGTERIKVKTQLCGKHWVTSVLGAIGGGLATGLTLSECTNGIARVAPFLGRMQPVPTADGVTFIRDDWKAPLWTVDSCLEFMTEARANRKIIVIGNLSDCGAGAPEKYVKVAKRAQDVADLTVFVGPWASQVLKARKPGKEDALRAFRNVRDAAEFINANTQEGDLVLLKGTNKQDHLIRIIMARTKSISCWRDDCELLSFCDECPSRHKPSGLPLLTASLPSPLAATQQQPLGLRAIGPDEWVIVGLGNPEPKYAGTPHNVGHRVVDQLATTLRLNWETVSGGWIARGAVNEQYVCLVKIQMAMNLTGAGLMRLSENMSFRPEQCIIVFDDLDMPIGSVRHRLSGGAGGHRGVASILEAFQTDAFRRVKVGVGKAGEKVDRANYVLTPFDASSSLVIEQALITAGDRILDMMERSRLAKRHSPED